ncbi:MAG: isoleucine--tRNA ligase [Hyphomicrobiaceae bacterium]|nr:isoleucine--tRNA ligase [Hyphomicrobiaceae bacterium]
MTDTTKGATEERDYSDTLFLPKTDFPMRAGLPDREPIWLERWEKMGLYKLLRAQSQGREKFTLHDGPPYANGNIHIGHALNKVLKDLVTRSMQMMGYNSAYVPGWDCHGLPIEWKIEEQYRAQGKNKDEVPVNEFRKECRDFALKWIDVQREEFKRLGVTGDWDNPYLTMDFEAEATIAAELHKFSMSGQLYRGSKPVMWSVVERTALAEAEIEYHEYESDVIWVKFPVVGYGMGEDPAAAEKKMETLAGSFVVIWTTTPWTIPANRAVSFSSKVAYGLYEVQAAQNPFGPQPGEKLVFADDLAQSAEEKAKLTIARIADVPAEDLANLLLSHPLKGFGNGYDFYVPMLDGEHVTAETGTGFVHTAPGHGADDFDVWMANARHIGQERAFKILDPKNPGGLSLHERSVRIDTDIPFSVDDAGYYTKHVPGFGPDAEGGAARIIDDKGNKGDANKRVIEALKSAGNLFAVQWRFKHQYAHSWRSKKPIIYRNTPQWFVYMDKDLGEGGDTLRYRALTAIDKTRFVPPQGQNRLRAMIAERPDWVLSRQRTWGVPIAVFVEKETGELLKDEAVNARIIEAFRVEGADAWFAEGAKARFLGNDYDASAYDMVMDILDVWFDSGSTHAFVLRNSKKWPDVKFPASMYLEGSDQHRGWFHSSLLQSCGTNGFAPYESVLTHGFTMDKDGFKMSKSLGNIIPPQDIIKQFGADILRLWASTIDYSEDHRIGDEILKTTVDSYRKMRNTFRWMLGTLAHFRADEHVAFKDLPELEKLMLHHLAVLDREVRDGYANYDYKRVVAALSNFMNLELSAFYFDVRKDALYCDPISSVRRRAALQVIDRLFNALVVWLAPVLTFTAEEIWLELNPGDQSSVHLQTFPDIPAEWLNDKLAVKWANIRKVRRVITGALEIERKNKTIGSSLEAAPKVFISDAGLYVSQFDVDMAEISITSGIEILQREGPLEAFRLEEVPGVSVEVKKAKGSRCARSWKYTGDVGMDPQWPDLSARDAKAMRERQAAGL